MAVQKVFKRYEYKYLLTREQKELLQNVMEEYMIPDQQIFIFITFKNFLHCHCSFLLTSCILSVVP